MMNRRHALWERKLPDNNINFLEKIKKLLVTQLLCAEAGVT